MAEIKTHKDLLVWKKSIDLVEQIYKFTKQFPKEELYGITNQMRRCAVSIPANIAEGSGRKNKAEFIQFLHIALGSASELETHLIISQRLGFLSSNSYDEIMNALNEIIKMICGLINSLNSLNPTRSS
ncbi:four helix bundle protein [Bacteroides ndongoniae]|uniref:four helix bundle protein n=1 Tax=Bacteroides TaxID=816 RepID=UPI000AE37E05|nr:four helix bundle protein [Bacteroides ndongoniae]